MSDGDSDGEVETNNSRLFSLHGFVVFVVDNLIVHNFNWRYDFIGGGLSRRNCAVV